MRLSLSGDTDESGPPPTAASPEPPMQTFKLVMPENLNHFGYLFGGYMLMWVDEIAWMAATLDFPDAHFVTIGMDKVEFKQSVREGTILEFRWERTHLGTTSVSYHVDVRAGNRPELAGSSIFSTNVALVRVDPTGKKVPIEPRKSA